MLLLEQIGRCHFQLCCNGIDELDRRIARSTLEIANVGPVDTNDIGKRLLAQPAFSAQATQIGGKAMVDIHIATQAPA